MCQIPQEQLLHGMRLWQLNAAIRGQQRKDRARYLSTRWQTWCILNALGAEGLRTPEDLVRFPFEQGTQWTEPPVTDEEIDELIRQCREENSRNGH